MPNKLVPIPMPLGGLNTINPFIDLSSGYARELTNYSIVNGRLRPRPAARIELSPSRTDELHWINKTGGIWYGIYRTSGEIRKLSDNTGATGTGGASQANATTCKQVGVELMFGARSPREVAYPFTAWGYTPSVLVATNIICGASHKSRLYATDGGTLEYSGVSAIGGPMVSAGSYYGLMDGQSIIRMFSLTVQPGNQAETVLCMFGSGGRVLIYQGDYPGSTTWSLLGKFDMPTPVSNQAFVEVDGDIFVLGDRYCYWARDLFTQAAQAAYDNSPVKPIENVWALLGWDGSIGIPEHAHAWYCKDIDAIICSASSVGSSELNLIADYDNEQVTFAYFRKYKSWAIWLNCPFFAPVVQVSGDTTYYGVGYSGRVRKIVPGNLRDQNDDSTEIDIETSWKTPYSEAFAGKVQKVNGVRVYYHNSISGYFHKIRALIDYSDFNAPLSFYAQSTVTAIPPGNYTEGQVDEPALTSEQYNHFKGVSGVGGGFSVQFTQKAKTASADEQEQEIYAAAVYVEDGGMFP